MDSKKICVNFKLPSGKKIDFSITPGENWKSLLEKELKNRYPVTSKIRFVEEFPNKKLRVGKTFESNVMLEVRENYFVLGHITARRPEEHN